jgi:hypothetical protein
MRIRTFAILAAFAVSGCTHSDSEKGLCPSAAVLAPTSALTVFRQNGPEDPSGEQYTVWMTNVKSGCDYDKDERAANSRIHIQFAARRPPAPEEANYRVPYFVTVTHGGSRIMTKKMYLAEIHFGAGQASASFEETVNDITIRFERGSKMGEYQILTGIQLTQAQLDYNNKNHHYAP